MRKLFAIIAALLNGRISIASLSSSQAAHGLTHIILVNLSHSEYGLMLPAHSYVSERKFELKNALDDALTLSRTGDDAVVLCIESSGGASEYFRLTLPRKTVVATGSSLDEIENILRKKGKTVDFYDLAFIAQNPIDWLQGIKVLSVNHSE